MEHPLTKYLRTEVFPTPFCPGCGHGILMAAILRAIDDLGLDFDNMLFVSGIGCAAWIPSPHFNADTLHTTHGRAVAFATGAKVQNPDLKVMVISGDGDLTAIGGNHLIHAARRNIDLTVICAENSVYGMTGGQCAPTTPLDCYTTTSPLGNTEPPFDLCKLVEGAGAGYVARYTVAHIHQLIKVIKTALNYEGFSFIEAVSPCPTQFGRLNSAPLAADLFNGLKKEYVALAKYNKMTEDERTGLKPVGEFVKGKTSVKITAKGAV
ncbi:MAG: 2-oxoacid:ferredoxin oxidoreductase subunit beta [FCB group bacterium]|nr:2-oxoacid:ferredoxin oxidoreductase subunit beta [FCB group bacterium]